MVAGCALLLKNILSVLRVVETFDCVLAMIVIASSHNHIVEFGRVNLEIVNLHRRLVVMACPFTLYKL